METSNHLMIPSLQFFNPILMSILNYFMLRSTKVIDNEITPICSPPPLESLVSPITIPDSQPTFLLNKSLKDSNSCSCLSQSRTLPIGLADAEEKEE